MLGILFVVLGVILDQVVKYWATQVLTIQSIVLIPGIFELTHVENRGAAFSILQNRISLFVIITLVVLCGIVYALYKHLVLTRLGQVALLMVASGALGNLVDRIIRGYVVDLFYFKLIDFPVFNVADILVVCGGILFVYYVLIQHDKVVAQKEALSKAIEDQENE